MRTHICVALGGAVLLLAGCATSSKPSAAPTPSTPAYRLVSAERRTVTVEVDQVPDAAGLAAILAAERARHGDDGGWTLLVNCSSGGTKAADNRLANGRWANGRLGAAQTGLAAGASEITQVDGATCP
jgi:hypothetical protein